MKFHVYTNEIRDALKIVTKCADPKPQTPILAAVKIDVDDKKLTLSANKFDIAAQVFLPVNCEEPGSVAVNAKLLNEVVNKFGGDTITFNDENGMLGARSEATKFQLRTFEVADFPTPNFDCDGYAKVRAKFLRSILRQSSFATDKTDGHPLFQSVNLTVTDRTITAVATNSHRISRAVSTVSNSDVNFIVNLPAASSKWLETALPDDFEVPVQIGSDGKSFVVKFANVAFRTRLIEGEFPPIDRLLDEEKPIVTRFNVREFKDALNRVFIISRSADYGVVTLELHEDKIVISSASADAGNVEATVQATAADDTDFIISFNGAYLLDFLNATEAKEIDARFSDKIEPAHFVEPDNDGYIYIVTPVRT